MRPVVAAVMLTACAKGTLPPSVALDAAKPNVPAWELAIEGQPEYVIVVRPKKLREEPLLRASLEPLLARFAPTPALLPVMLAADEVVAAAGVLVLRGVPADADPTKIDASLVASGSGAWAVVAKGDERERAKERVAPIADAGARDPGAVIAVHVTGSPMKFWKRTPLDGFEKGCIRASFYLDDQNVLTAGLEYDGVEHAEDAEGEIDHLIAVSRDATDGSKWFGRAEFKRVGTVLGVQVRAPVTFVSTLLTRISTRKK